jgi:hypothetical protein
MAKPRDGSDPDDEPMPRWVKLFGLVALVLIAAFVVVHLLRDDMVHHAPARPADHSSAHGPARDGH